MSRITHEREYEDHEYVAMAIKKGRECDFGNLNANFKLYNSANAAVFFFENNEEERVLNAEFTLQKRNLALVGEEENVSDFSIQLLPRETTYKLLKSVDKSRGTALGMSYKYW